MIFWVSSFTPASETNLTDGALWFYAKMDGTRLANRIAHLIINTVNLENL